MTRLRFEEYEDCIVATSPQIIIIMTAVGAGSAASSAATHGDTKCIETICEVEGRRLVEFGWGGRDYYDYLH
jgi:hypothetical protein